MIKYVLTGTALIVTIIGAMVLMKDKSAKYDISQYFREIENAAWEEVFYDPCTQNWQQHWHLDGLKATITTNPNGMDFLAGPTYRDDSCHAVLWTRESFHGPIKIEYEYTKIDTFAWAVTIIYPLASGNGEGPYKKDVFEWNHLRIKPAMRAYYNNMNTYHISYAAFPANNADSENDYIRARRYMPLAKNGLQGTALEPDYIKTGLFKTGIPYKITIIQKGDDLFMHISGDSRDMLCHWDTSSHPPVTEGRIGLRHMFTRAARYRDFRVSALKR